MKLLGVSAMGSVWESGRMLARMESAAAKERMAMANEWRRGMASSALLGSWEILMDSCCGEAADVVERDGVKVVLKAVQAL